MGYFSNGTEGDRYYERWCANCVHRPDDETEDACPVWSVHLAFAYVAKDDARAILDALIPRGAPENEQCLMFVEDRQARLPL